MDYLHDGIEVQNTSEWSADRLGRFTSSRAPELMNSNGLLYRIDSDWVKLSDIEPIEGKTSEELCKELFPTITFTFEVEKSKIFTAHEKLKKRYNVLTATGFKDFVKDVYETFGESREVMGAGAKSYVLQVAYEIITGQPSGFEGNFVTEWGHENEPFAVKEYEEVKGITTDVIGFVPHPTNSRAGGSPDRLVGSDGVVEIKCPYNGLNHAKYILTDALEKDYYWQCMYHLWVTGRKWCDLVSFDPRVKGKGKCLHVIRFERDEQVMKKIETRVNDACELLKEYLTSLGYAEESNIF